MLDFGFSFLVKEDVKARYLEESAMDRAVRLTRSRNLIYEVEKQSHDSLIL